MATAEKTDAEWPTSALWDAALAFYARPGAAPLLIDAQDQHGQDVCLILFALWAEPLDQATLSKAEETASSWRAAATAPLRKLRRDLKAQEHDIDEKMKNLVRDHVKEAELASERACLMALGQLATPAPDGRSALANLAAIGVPRSIASSLMAIAHPGDSGTASLSSAP